MDWTTDMYWSFKIAAEKRKMNMDLIHYYAVCRNMPAVKALACARQLVTQFNMRKELYA